MHPSDEFSLANEGQLGKTEMWYIVDAEEGAGIYMGFKKSVTKEEFTAAIENGTVEDILNFIEVKAGEHYFIKSGTVHAIGAGTTICEIQQNSNVTYRVYDYGRRDAFGNARELHTEKALAVSELEACAPVTPCIIEGDARRIGVSKYFTVHSLSVSNSAKWSVDKGSFCVISAVFGEGSVNGQPIKLGDSLFVPAGYGNVEIEGKVSVIITSLRSYFATVKQDGDKYSAKITDDLGAEIAQAFANSPLSAVNLALKPFGADANDLKNIEVEYTNEIKTKR